MSLPAARAAWIASDARTELRRAVELAIRAALAAAGAPGLALEQASEVAAALVGQVDLLVAAPVQLEADEIGFTDHREAP